MDYHPPMNAWHGKALHVDLTSKRSWTEKIPEELLTSFIGGRGLGVHLKGFLSARPVRHPHADDLCRGPALRHAGARFVAHVCCHAFPSHGKDRRIFGRRPL